MINKINTVLLSIFLTVGPALAQIGPPPISFPILYLSVNVAAPLDCVGGTVTEVGNQRIHTFTSSDTLTCGGSGTISYLVVGGGGGGG